MRYEYAIYDILGWISGVVFNKWNFILVVPLLAWIAMISPLLVYWMVVSLLVQSLLVCGIVWGVSMRGKEYRNLYDRSLTQKGTFMRYTTIVTIIIATAVVAASVTMLVSRIEIAPILLLQLAIVLIPVALILILQSILGVIVLLVSRSQMRRMFRASIFKYIVQYIVVTMVSFLLTSTIWTLSLFVSIFCGWLAYPLIIELYMETRSVVPERNHVTFLCEVLVTSFVLFVLARVLIAVWGYRRSNTEGAR